MATAEWDSHVLSGRFKTTRQRKRLVKKERDRKLIQQFKELQRLRREQHELGFRDLIPPVQKGWKRFFVMRPDLLISKDKDFFLALLEKINTVQYSHRKDFKKKRRRHGKKVHVDTVQKLQEFYEYQYNKSKLTEKEKTYFRMEWRFNDRNRMYKVYVFTDPWRYVLQVRPNMITKQRVIDPQLQSSERGIDAFLERNNLYPRLFKLIDGHYSNRDRWKMRDKEKYQQITNSDPLDEIE